MDESIPIFRASDAAKSAEWYGRLGFAIESEHRFAPSLPLYVTLRRKTARLHLSEHRGDANPGGLAYFYFEDLEGVAKEFSIEPAEQPWGREIKLEDPDGNRLRIGESGA